VKEIVEYFGKKQVFFRTLELIDLKKLGTRKKLSLYLGVDMKAYYTVIIYSKKKSTILRKEADELMLLHGKLEKESQTKIKKKYLLLEAPICSKAKGVLENEGWRVELL